MAYLIFADRTGELARHELQPHDGPVTIGRSIECGLIVHDALLSRQHCRIEPVLDGWVVTDLGSKNGTRVDDRLVTRHTLADGDVLRIGRTGVCFRAGAFVPAAVPGRPAHARPIEALAGTVAGFRVPLPPAVDTATFPRPQPRPAPGHAASAVEAHSLVTGLSSSAWDSLLTAGSDTRTALLARARPRVTPNPTAAPAPIEPAPHLRIGRLLAVATAAVAVVLTTLVLLTH
jgi:predicted component of type VI protein secretion system